ncbi:MAG: hypothetical protein M1833_003267 [Piccolia ochrophora]|nr:MAG: hypothetical protein M1833_003267 [Piccolia ochrophora]
MSTTKPTLGSLPNELKAMIACQVVALCDYQSILNFRKVDRTFYSMVNLDDTPDRTMHEFCFSLASWRRRYFHTDTSDKSSPRAEPAYLFPFIQEEDDANGFDPVDWAELLDLDLYFDWNAPKVKGGR